MTVSLPDSYPSSRDELRRVATHIVARAREQATGRFGLRVTPGGFGTPEFGDEPRRVRVSGAALIVESGATGAASTRTAAIDGATLVELAIVAGVDLSAELSVGHDTPPLGDVDAQLTVDAVAAAAVAQWFDVVARALDRTAAGLDVGAAPSMAQLWPEHFDVAYDVAYDASAPGERRVNLGGSAGDGFHDAPYLYVGPWTDDRPGDPAFWDAPFGAVLGWDAVTSTDDPVATATAFYQQGVAAFSA
jgi:hypothetical protein